MESAPSRSDADIARLMPELGLSCGNAPQPGWPEDAAMTAVMTAPGFKDHPMPAEVLYDWRRKSQRTRTFRPSHPHPATGEALLLNGYGYSIDGSRGHLSCSASLPGVLRPNWPQTGGCSCEAVIRGKTNLTSFDGAQIMVCPMTDPRVVWSWFTLDGRPIVFMETSAPGDEPVAVLTLADYHVWEPGHLTASTAFDSPRACPAPGAAVPASPESPNPMRTGSRRCGACHLDTPAH